MSRTDRIKILLEKEFFPIFLNIQNDSDKHKGHAGYGADGESHFTITLYSKKFLGLNRVARQRLVYDLLKTEFEQGLHAVSLKLGTEEEFKQN
jgi:BolA protein